MAFRLGDQMRAIDRVNAERRIITAMQQQMKWEEVRRFFDRLKINGNGYGSIEDMDYESYTRLILDNCSDADIVEVADQLQVDISRQSASTVPSVVVESKYWLIDHFRVFISHVHTVRQSAGNLRASLQAYSISAFVAHDDIEPSDEWREEILASLRSMDALLAILTPDFNTSKWTDQEVGVAIATDPLIIPINRGQIPYGFMEKFQALPSSGLNTGQVAASVFRTLSTNSRTRGRIVESLIRTIATGSDAAVAQFRIQKLNNIQGVDVESWKSIRENIAGNAALRSSKPLLDVLNPILKTKSIGIVGVGEKSAALDDEIPF